MPELPEVQTVVNELNKSLKNRKISRIEVHKGKLVSVGPQTVSNLRDESQSKVDKFVKLLTGHKFVSVKRRGKMLIFDLSGPLAMLVHLKMTGQFIFEDKALRKKTGSQYRIVNKPNAPLVKLPSKSTHVVFHFSDGSTLYYNDVRQFGYLRVVRDEDLDKVKEFQEYGPEPLEKSFTFEVFKQNIQRRKKTAIKLAIMDPKVVVGIGNIYSDEILYFAGVRPQRKVGSLTTKALQAIYDNIRPVLLNGIKYKGSSVGEFVRTNGTWGTMGQHHFVYGRKKQKCKRCGTMLVTIKLGGRSGTYCPKEQL